jgi:predicted phosphoribosyltransferase
MFESFRAKFQFQLRFKDRVNAANIVAAALSDRLSKEERTNACVLGIPRGGVIVADVVALKLQTNNFQIIVPRKLTVLHNEELAFGAVMLDGMTYLNDDLDVPSEYVEIEKTRQIQEIRRRMQLYLATDNMNYLDSSKLDNTATVILVDDVV